MKKSWLIMIGAIFLCLGVTTQVKADFNAGITEPGNSQICTKDICVTNQPKLGTPNLGTFFSGFRVSMVDVNGNRVPGTVSVDYLNNSADVFELQNATNIIFYNRKFTRQEIANAYDYWTTSAEGGVLNSGYQVNTASCGTACTQKNLSNYIANIHAEAERLLTSRISESMFVEAFNGTEVGMYARATGYDISKYMTCSNNKCEYKSHILQFEPIVKTRVTQKVGSNKYAKFYVGTVTETYGLIRHVYGNDVLNALAKATQSYREFGGSPGNVIITTSQDFPLDANGNKLPHVGGLYPFTSSAAYQEVLLTNTGVATGSIWIKYPFEKDIPLTCAEGLKDASKTLDKCLSGKGFNTDVIAQKMLQQLKGTTYPFKTYSNTYFGTNGIGAVECANAYIAKKNELALKYPNDTSCNPKPGDGGGSNQCDINNPLHFIGGLTSNTGPNGENCCQYFIDLYQNNSYQLENFYKKYPKCDNRPKCDPEVQTPGQCEMNGSYSDTKNWNSCIYNNNEYKQTGLNLDSNVCSVYCREDFETLFPGNFVSVKAGQQFVWNTIRVSGTMECRTTEIDLNKWKAKWDTLNDVLPGYYDDWQIAKKKQESIDKALKNGEASESCDCIRNFRSGDCCIRTETEEYDSTCNTGEVDENGKPEKEPCTKTRTVCAETDTSTSNRYTLYTPEGFTYDGSKYQVSPWCSRGSNSSKPNPQLSYYEPRYKNALNNKNQWETALDNCNDWKANYDLGTKISINHSYMGNNNTFDLEPQVTQNSSTKYYCKDSADGSCSTNKYASMTNGNYLKSYKCTAEGCYSWNSSNTYQFKMPNNKYVKETISKKVDYHLPDYVYRYVLKPSGLAVHYDELPQYNKENGLFYDIGYGNLPVAYGTPPGTYPISLQYNYLGHKGHFDKSVPGLTNNGANLTYECTYRVYNEILGEDPNPKGIEVVYRPIDLNNPFPGLNGDGRKPGDNWQGDNDGDGISDYIEKIITNNRGVNTDEVYNQEPMFEFVLTPENIKKIKKYNNSIKNGEGYADFNLVCKDGQKCESTFIRSNDSLGKLFAKASGVCYSYSEGSTWDTCQYKG